MYFSKRAIFQGLIFFGVVYVVLSLAFPSTKYQPWAIPSLPESTLRTLRKHAINNTVIFVPVNTGMLHFADNLLCSLRAIDYDPSNIIFWALDENAEKVLASQGRPTYFDPSLYSSSQHENDRGDTKAFRRMMKERPKFYLDVLAAGFDLLTLDTDVVFFSSPELIIPQPNANIDAVFSTDSREFYQDKDAFHDDRRRGSIMPPVCNGIFWMKSSQQSIDLWREMLDVFERPSWWSWFRRNTYFQDDQRGMDVMLNDGRAQLVEPLPTGILSAQVPHPKDATFKVSLLDQTQVVNGHLVVNRASTYEKNLKALQQTKPGKDRIAVHFNWGTKELAKVDGARRMGFWHLKEDGSCKA